MLHNVDKFGLEPDIDNIPFWLNDSASICLLAEPSQVLPVWQKSDILIAVTQLQSQLNILPFGISSLKCQTFFSQY